MKKTIILAASISLLSSMPSIASEQAQNPIMNTAKVKQADTNHNHEVTKMEFLKAYTPSYASLMIVRGEKEFNDLDTDNDGVISSKDYR